MKVFVAALVFAAIVAAGMSIVLNSVQRPSYEAFATGSARVGNPGHNPVGNYAVRIGFDDMHSTGIYSWAFLRDLGMNAGRRFQDYLDDLQAKGLDRDRPGMR